MGGQRCTCGRSQMRRSGQGALRSRARMRARRRPSRAQCKRGVCTCGSLASCLLGGEARRAARRMARRWPPAARARRARRRIAAPRPTRRPRRGTAGAMLCKGGTRRGPTRRPRRASFLPPTRPVAAPRASRGGDGHGRQVQAPAPAGWSRARASSAPIDGVLTGRVKEAQPAFVLNQFGDFGPRLCQHCFLRFFHAMP